MSRWRSRKLCVASGGLAVGADARVGIEHRHGPVRPASAASRPQPPAPWLDDWRSSISRLRLAASSVTSIPISGASVIASVAAPRYGRRKWCLLMFGSSGGAGARDLVVAQAHQGVDPAHQRASLAARAVMRSARRRTFTWASQATPARAGRAQCSSNETAAGAARAETGDDQVPASVSARQPPAELQLDHAAAQARRTARCRRERGSPDRVARVGVAGGVGGGRLRRERGIGWGATLAGAAQYRPRRRSRATSSAALRRSCLRRIRQRGVARLAPLLGRTPRPAALMKRRARGRSDRRATGRRAAAHGGACRLTGSSSAGCRRVTVAAFAAPVAAVELRRRHVRRRLRPAASRACVAAWGSTRLWSRRHA